MRTRHIVIVAALGLVSCVVALEQTVGQMAFRTKHGEVVFDHVAHTKRAGYNCMLCHTKTFKIFPPLSRGPLNFQPILHRRSEASKTSCGLCHRSGGEAFPSSGHCRDCHLKPVIIPYFPDGKM